MLDLGHAAELVDDLIQAHHDYEVFGGRSYYNDYLEIKQKVIDRLRGVAQAAPELPYASVEYLGGNKEEYMVIKADAWRKFVSSLPSTEGKS